jgi:hypothetical protein
MHIAVLSFSLTSLICIHSERSCKLTLRCIYIFCMMMIWARYVWNLLLHALTVFAVCISCICRSRPGGSSLLHISRYDVSWIPAAAAWYSIMLVVPHWLQLCHTVAAFSASDSAYGLGLQLHKLPASIVQHAAAERMHAILRGNFAELV